MQDLYFDSYAHHNIHATMIKDQVPPLQTKPEIRNPNPEPEIRNPKPKTLDPDSESLSPPPQGGLRKGLVNKPHADNPSPLQ